MTRIQDELAALTAPGGPFEVAVERVRGISVRTFVDRPRHLAAIADRGAGHDGEFLVGPERRLSFAETVDRSRRLAAGWRSRYGVEPGDRIAVLGANAPDWVVAFWAGVMLDAVVVPLNAWWTPSELAFALGDAGVSLVAADERRAASMAAASTDLPVAVWDTDFDAMVGQFAPIGDVGHRDEDAPALLFYTSGTTGTPKGVVLTHRNVVSGFLNSVAMTTAARNADPASTSKGRQVDLSVIPLFHATANLAIMVPFLAAGHTLVFLRPGPFDPEVAATTIEREGVTRFGGVPTIVNRMLESEAGQRHDLSSVERVSYGGAPASPDLVARVEGAFPSLRHRVVQGYGLTETTAIATLNQGADHAERPDSVGIAAPTVELQIDGATRPGDEGEILVRGANVFPGYWNRPDEQPFTSEGFFRTGDIGRLDADGFLRITDRAKDVIVRGGENISSLEVEDALAAHPAVREVAVVAAPDPDLGEVVRAFVFAPGSTVDELRAHVAGRLAPFKVPAIWDLVDEPLPRTPTGKVLKNLLRGGERSVFEVGSDSPL